MSIIILSLIICLDQLTKFIFRINFLEGEKYTLIDQFLTLTFLKNRGAAFGILSGQRNLFILLTILFFVFIIYMYKFELPAKKSVEFGTAFLLAGGISNLIDRLFLHYVTDFIAFNLFGFYNLPVINFADIFIFFGVLILIYQLLFSVDRGV
ncbi:signal peptidase II [Halanaerobium praevalens]|uniref:Lipoprotein signal peptidase n=1 Tax=Halanaerobium praevalens (strain ATCC 33744 / DSM 2228 / GSL) TaxID=572479 RepID=E3DQI9_HALPG|nr:signal peptidase II [Halanaerobium praevalens]ADO76885.1 lipoprotein signal peptidase [Halanaerobium praevalens DSM 2228]